MVSFVEKTSIQWLMIGKVVYTHDLLNIEDRILGRVG